MPACVVSKDVRWPYKHMLAGEHHLINDEHHQRNAARRLINIAQNLICDGCPHRKCEDNLICD